jgi:hypothetical protein
MRTIAKCDYKDRVKVKCQLQSFKNVYYKSSNEACMYVTGTIWYVGYGVCHGAVCFWRVYNVATCILLEPSLGHICGTIECIIKALYYYI